MNSAQNTISKFQFELFCCAERDNYNIYNLHYEHNGIGGNLLCIQKKKLLKRMINVDVFGHINIDSQLKRANNFDCV